MKLRQFILLASTIFLSSTFFAAQSVAKETSASSQDFAWRGLMIDVSRHFMSLDFLKRQVFAMSHFGLNKLHLHLCDAAGWRLEIKSHPRLTQFGAWRTAPNWKQWWNDGKRHYAEEGSADAFGGYYTQQEMHELVRYADSLGVEIVPEIEFPAHSEEVTAAYPELGCTGLPYQCADFCLGNEQTYVFLQNVLGELTQIFTSPYIHMGGDEAGGGRWKVCPKCQDKMHQLGINTTRQLQQYAMQRVALMVDAKGKKMIGWDEILPKAAEDTTSLKPIIMVWRDPNTAQQALRQGHDVILCPGRWCYLDAYQDAPIHEPEAMGGYTPLKKVWELSQQDFLLDCLSTKEKLPKDNLTKEKLPKEKLHKEKRPKEDKVVSSQPTAKLLGTQVNLWTEYVPNEKHAERMIWPRALAVSSFNNETDYPSFRKKVIKKALPWLRQHGITPFPLEKEVGQRRESGTSIKCLSTGKKVTYLSPYYYSYAAGGEKALTDGLQGGWTNTDGRWQGFISPERLYVVIDLESVQDIGSIEASFMQSMGPEIYLPEHIRISISNDGEHFTLLHDQKLPPCSLTTDIQTHGWHGQAKARYVRFQALNGKRGGWIFTDEIIVAQARSKGLAAREVKREKRKVKNTGTISGKRKVK